MENALIFKKILPTNSLRKCMEISFENLYVDIKGLRQVQAQECQKKGGSGIVSTPYSRSRLHE